MVSAQLDVGIAQALVRLRAYAFSHQRLSVEVAADVVARRLRLDDRDTWRVALRCARAREAGRGSC